MLTRSTSKFISSQKFVIKCQKIWSFWKYQNQKFFFLSLDPVIYRKKNIFQFGSNLDPVITGDSRSKTNLLNSGFNLTARKKKISENLVFFLNEILWLLCKLASSSKRDEGFGNFLIILREVESGLQVASK